MNKENIEQILKRLAAEDVPVDVHKIAEETSENFSKTLTQTREHILWSNIMRSRITKVAAAAGIIIAVVLSVSLWDKSIPAAYAIEQTIEAFEKVNSVYVEQIIREKGTLLNTKMWARRGRHGKFFFGNFRLESGNKEQITVVNESENRTYIYNPSAKTVYIYDRLNVTIGSFLDKGYFLHLQQEMENVELEYDKDKITGKEVVILKYKVPIPGKYDKSIVKSDVITFDLETKLPIRRTSWDNPDFKGEPYSEWILIEYDPELPEDTFKFEIPEDATVIRE
jgi:outer membrane lipoprotein-sorting protein